ncbi:MAG: hypothetical protein AABZ06_10745 [Bdellovibrionota bacterium]
MLLKKNYVKYCLSIMAVTALVVASGCAKATDAVSAATAGVDLSDLPNASDMVKTNTSSSNARVDLSQFRIGASIGDIFAVSGTPPILSQINDNNADTYFWNGLVATFNQQNYNPTQSEKQQFWGGADGGPGGGGACYMSQSVAQSFGRMLEAGTSLCYMRNMPTATSGVTLDTAIAAAELFSQQADDKIVKVAASMPGEGTMHVFIKVFGSNTVTSDVYKVRLWFCQNGVSDGSEEVSVNTASGVYSASSEHSGQWGTGKSTISAYLKQNTAGAFVFDSSKSRTADSHFQGDWGTFKGNVTITSDDKIYAKMLNKNSYNNTEWINKNYTVASFSGSNLADLRFLAGGFKGASSGTGYSENSYSGGTEFQNTHYVATNTSTLKTEAELLDFTTDSYYASITSPSIDVSSNDCSATPNINVTMDFADAAVAAISAKCEGEKLLENMNYCNSAAVQAAQQKTWQ